MLEELTHWANMWEKFAKQVQDDLRRIDQCRELMPRTRATARPQLAKADTAFQTHMRWSTD